MAVSAHLMTAEELRDMPGDGCRYELVKGELRSMPPAGYEHGRDGMNFAAPLAVFVKAHGLGRVCLAETGFILSRNPDTVRAADAAFISREQLLAKESTKGYWVGAPDLAMEVVSPGDASSEVEVKALEWLEAGCRMVVVINPRKRTVTVYRSLSDIVLLTENDIFDGGDVVPGWTLPVRDIFD